MASFTQIDISKFTEDAQVNYYEEKCAVFQEKPETEKPETEKPETEKPETEKPETEEPQTEKPELEHVNEMTIKYGEENWMWYVENTDEDCRIASMHRSWLVNKGVPPDFNIRYVTQTNICRCKSCEEDLKMELEAANAWENSEEKKIMEYENNYKNTMF